MRTSAESKTALTALTRILPNPPLPETQTQEPMSKTKKTIKSEIEEVEHEIVMENARHSDESLRLTRRLNELYFRLREAECQEMAATAAEQMKRREEQS